MARVLTVLIVEDDVLIADLLEEFLVAGGIDVCGVAGTVEEAVVLADLYKPDLAVIDMHLADGGSGADIRPRLKDKAGMGILFVAGDGSGGQLCSDDGEAFIAKPYRMSDVLKALELLQKMKLDKDIPSSFFPDNVHLLSQHDDLNGEAA